MIKNNSCKNLQNACEYTYEFFKIWWKKLKIIGKYCQQIKGFGTKQGRNNAKF